MMVLFVILLLCWQLVSSEYPPHPYAAVWNSPTTHCFGNSLELSGFEILQNRGDAINGGNITLFTHLGQFPVWGKLNDTIVNGGLPQLGNLSLHLAQVEQDIDSLIPDSNFAGLAVIDFQAWRPLFRQNFDELGIYQTQSVEEVRKKHPDWKDEQLQKEAAAEFNSGARAFLEGTLLLARKLRPGGLWGYLGYPFCNGFLGYYCDGQATLENDMIGWLWNASTALYPSVFYGKFDQGDRVISLVSVIHESHRLMVNRSYLYSNLYLYTRYTYIDAPKKFYSKSDIQQSTQFANLFGVNAVVVYASSAHMNSKEFCSSLLDFINGTYGPITKSTYDQAVQCSNDRCNGHGQCVDMSEGNDKLLKVDSIRIHYEEEVNAEVIYVCRCYHGWQGEDCNEPV